MTKKNFFDLEVEIAVLEVWAGLLDDLCHEKLCKSNVQDEYRDRLGSVDKRFPR